MSPHIGGFVVDHLGVLASWQALLGKSALEKAGAFPKSMAYIFSTLQATL